MTHDPLSLTRELLVFNTIKPPGNERDCAEFLGGLLESAGFDTRYYESVGDCVEMVRELEKTLHSISPDSDIR